MLPLTAAASIRRCSILASIADGSPASCTRRRKVYRHSGVETPVPSSSTPRSANPLAHLTSLQAMLLLGSVGMLPTLWSEMLFPAIMSIQQDLGTSASAVQQTI